MDAAATTPEEDGLDALSARIGAAVRERRLAHRWSLGDLARGSGLSKTILARIERGEGNPSVETLWRVSRALDVPLGALLSPPAGPRARAIPARASEPIRSETGMAAWLLHAAGADHRGELYDIDLPRGADQRTDAHLLPGTEELILCVKGRVRVGPHDQEIELGPGDAAWFTADVPHHYVALRDTRMLCWMIYPAARGEG